MAILAWDHSRESVKVRHSPFASENVTNNQPFFGDSKMLNMTTLPALPVPEIDMSVILKVIEKL